MDMFSLEWFITKGVLLFVSLPVHEWAHAFAAYKLGDDTAALQGRLTLNPIAHWDLFGTLAILFTPFGWGKPVPVNPYRLRGNMRTSRALVSIAGPFSNLIIAMLAAIPFRMRWLHGSGAFVTTLGLVLGNLVVYDLYLMLFNLIPLPPLDGSRILARLLPPRWAHVMDQVERYGGIGLFIFLYLITSSPLFGMIMDPVMRFLVDALVYY